MNLVHIIILAVIQGLAELLPVSSSAHVICAAKLLHEDPTTPQFGLLLVMLHTGTMFAVMLYFWRTWKKTFFHSESEFIRVATKIVIATGLTGGIGLGLMKGIERYLDPGYTQLVSWSLTERGVTHRPTPATPLTHLVATEDPTKPLFKTGKILTVSGIKNGEPLPFQTLEIKPETTLQDLENLLQHGYGITPGAAPAAHIPAPGVTIEKDLRKPAGIHIVINGNAGSENHLKFKDESLADQDGITPFQFADESKGEVEQLFKRLDLMAAALAAAGVIIILSGIKMGLQRRSPRKSITTTDSIAIGTIQGFCLPFRGLSRSGATISVGLWRGIARMRAEEFSFALAVVLTPPVLGYELYRLMKHLKESTPIGMTVQDLLPGLKGMGFAFIGGLIALKILSKLLEKGQWWLFGVYCLAAAGGIYWMQTHGYGAVDQALARR